MVEWEFSDEVQSRNTIYAVLTFFLVGAVLLWFYLDPVYTSVAGIFMMVYFLAMGGWLLNIVTKGVREEAILETNFWRTESPLGDITGKKLLFVFLGSLMFAIWIFFQIANTGASFVGAPSHLMQAVPQTFEVQVVLTIAAAIAENMLFFFIIMPTMFGLVYKLTKNVPLAFVLGVVILAPGIFMGYHFVVYGTALMTQFLSVYVFGLINCVMTFIFRQPFFADFFHISNNLAVTAGKAAKIGFFVAGGS